MCVHLVNVGVRTVRLSTYEVFVYTATKMFILSEYDTHYRTENAVQKNVFNSRPLPLPRTESVKLKGYIL